MTLDRVMAIDRAAAGPSVARKTASPVRSGDLARRKAVPVRVVRFGLRKFVGGAPGDGGGARLEHRACQSGRRRDGKAGLERTPLKQQVREPFTARGEREPRVRGVRPERRGAHEDVFGKPCLRAGIDVAVEKGQAEFPRQGAVEGALLDQAGFQDRHVGRDAGREARSGTPAGASPARRPAQPGTRSRWAERFPRECARLDPGSSRRIAPGGGATMRRATSGVKQA